MCGIAGKLSLTSQPVTESSLRQMAQAVAHRGPDDEGIYLSPNGQVGLAHRRLSIIDLSAAGHQPMPYRGRYWIVFNGEIYNFAALREELTREGYTFASHTDTEVIPALYDKYQEKCVDYLDGMFAFALYDAQEQVLFCARDRVGKKPFKYWYDGRTLLFASELKAILTQPEYHAEPDWMALHHYLTLQYVPSPLTGFKDIKKLPPAHYLRFDLTRKKLTLKRYWQLDFSAPTEQSEQAWLAGLDTQLRHAVSERLRADVPLGVFLSGGLDSSAIVALAREYVTTPLKTFSIGFAHQEYNELSHAARVAAHFKTEHTEQVVAPETVDIVPYLVRQFEEPFADSSALPTYLLSLLTRRQVKVALTGDGGDENFAGYGRYSVHKFAARFAPALAPVKSLVNAGARTAAQAYPSTFTMRAERFAATALEPDSHRYVNYLCYFTNQMKAALYTPEFAASVAGLDSYEIVSRHFKDAATDSVNQALYADIQTYLPDDLLVKLDIASMAVGLEARSPLLDYHLLEYTAKMPGSLKLKGLNTKKYIFKKYLAGHLPHDIIHRPKMGFRVPIEHWFREGLGSYVTDTLSSPRAAAHGLFRPEAVDELLQRHRQTDIDHAPQLWALLTLELWFREYFD